MQLAAVEKLRPQDIWAKAPQTRKQLALRLAPAAAMLCSPSFTHCGLDMS
jgi:hypothetical protein